MSETDTPRGMSLWIKIFLAFCIAAMLGMVYQKCFRSHPAPPPTGGTTPRPTDASDIHAAPHAAATTPAVADAGNAPAAANDASAPAAASSEPADAGAAADPCADASPETIGASYAAPQEPTPPSRPALNCHLGSERFPGTCATLSAVGMVFQPPSTEPVLGWNCGPITNDLRINFRSLTINNCACQYCEPWPAHP